MNTALPYRPNVCMIVINSDNHLFLGERYGESNVWQFPQGGVETNESLEENVLRELEEEIGAPRAFFSIVQKLNATHRYDFAKPPAYAVGRWRGQEQSFWLVRFTGDGSEINLNAHQPEFSRWMWCPLSEVVTWADPKRVAGYMAALEEVGEIIESL